MKLFMKFSIIITLLLFSICAFAKVNITVTTNLLKSVTTDITGDKASVSVLMPTSACPGTFDCSPNDISKANKSKIIFYHGYESFIKSFNTKNKIVQPICKDKNILIPKNYIKALNEVYTVVVKEDPTNSKYYKNNLSKSIEKVNKLEKKLIVKTKAFKNVNVICAVEIKDFVSYLGYNVVISYPKANKISPKFWAKVAKLGKEKKVKLCIDNIQSGEYTSAQLAKDINAKHIALSNFPNGFKNTETYEKCLQKNIEICLKVK